MFFHMSMDKDIQLHPRYFGPRLQDMLTSKLHSEVEGTCTGRYGFIVTVTGITEVGKGKIESGQPLVTFKIKYNAIVFRPFKGEVLDAVVTQVNKAGFFAEAGPLTTFVSIHMIPSDFEFAPNENPPCFRTRDDSQTITKDDRVRLRILGLRVDAADIFAIASVNEDYLGVVASSEWEAGQ